ncbi:hypothetical protein C8Q70DRAFT_474569 [Cubamyces menziesii]|nr:hypothetical protein C8Q70DRAFT_474569 [Cubamyces menziesii]
MSLPLGLHSRQRAAGPCDTLQATVLDVMTTTTNISPSRKANHNLDSLESLVQNNLDAASHRLEQLKYVHNKTDADKVAKKIIQGTSSALEFLHGLADAHPIASIVVNLERQRHENDAHIAVVHTSMLKAVFHLRILNHEDQSSHKDSASLNAAMKELCESMTAKIHSFGEFVDSYHGHWQRTVKFVFSYVLRKKLEDFSQEFDKLVREMDSIYKSTMQIQMATVVTNTTEILRRLSFEDPDARHLKHLVPKKEGDDATLRNNQDHIKKVAAQMKEKLTHTMRGVLQEDYDNFLQRHASRYRLKCESIEREMHLASERQAVRISGGPHQLIEDKDVQLLWSSNNWRATVKCRHFVEGLHEYYHKQLHFGSSDLTDTSDMSPREQPGETSLAEKAQSVRMSKDAWTLEYFSRSMYYAAIGDIIDDDGSGYISALEVNIFLKSEQRCLRKWSKPQWFAFWASGWHNNNAWYHDETDRMMHGLLRIIQEAGPDSRDAQWANIKNMLQSLKPLILVMDSEEVSGTGMARNHVPHQLLELQEEFRQHEEEAISSRLRQFGTHLTDGASIVAVVGDARIELHIMPLIYVLIKLLNDLVAKVANQRHRNAEDMREIEALAMSCITVFVAFDDRLRELSRGWRLEAKDIGMQVDRYADGLFKKYYAEPGVFHKAYDDLRCCMFGEEYELPLHLRPVMRSQLSAPVDAVAILSKRVEALERTKAGTAEQEAKEDGEEWWSVVW